MNEVQFPGYDARAWTYDNGLVLIVQEDHSAPVASVQAWCQTGSIHEGERLGAGLSHILEHMLFKGTETRSTNEIAQSVQSEGGYINAYTSYDRTVYWIDTPKNGVAMAIDILADAMSNSTLPLEEYGKEQEVIRREFAMGYDDPDRMSAIALFANAYREHPYRLPVIGHLDIYNTLTRDDVLHYYKARYVPNNIFFVIVGDVTAEHVRGQLEHVFGKQPRRALSPVYIPKEPPQLGARESHVEFKTELTRLNVGWHIPQGTHPDLPPLDLLGVILGDGRSARLYQRLREKLALVHNISAFAYAPYDPGLFVVEATLDHPNREAAEQGILETIAEVQDHGVSAAELEKAKKRALSHQLQMLTTMRGKASDLGSSWLLTRNLNFSRDYLRALQNVTCEDLTRVSQLYFADQNRTSISLNPIGSLESVIRGEPKTSAGDIEKFTLPNGLRLLVREDSRLPMISVIAVFKCGLLAETAERNGITRLFSRVLLKGTTNRTSEQIADEIEAAGGAIGSDAGNNSLSITVRTLKPDLELGIDILADVLLNATLPEKAIDREKEVQIAAIKAEEEQLTSIARNTLRERLFSNHPYGLRNLGTFESVAKLSPQELREFYTTYIAGENGVIGVFGDVNADEVKQMMEAKLAQLPAGAPALTHPPLPLPLPSEVVAEEIRDKTQAVLMVGYIGSDLFSADRYALELIDEASSDLGSRFFIRIREEMGLAYYVGSSHMMGLVPGPFVFYLGTAPEKIEAVNKEFLDEISQLARDGLSEDELSRAKAKLLGQLEIHNQSNAALAYSSALDELYGLGFDHYKTLKQKISRVTLEQVRNAARKYFDTTSRVIAIVRPPVK
jgi:zinc protease